MSGYQRPGGLTVLAVLNFVFGGITGLGVLGSAVLLVGGKPDELPPGFREWPDPAMIIALAVGNLIVAVLMILSGIGYLSLRRTQGFVLGTLYALVAIVVEVIGLSTFQQLTMSSFMSLLYPLLTLFMLQVVFRRDFARVPA